MINSVNTDYFLRVAIIVADCVVVLGVLLLFYVFFPVRIPLPVHGSLRMVLLLSLLSVLFAEWLARFPRRFSLFSLRAVSVSCLRVAFVFGAVFFVMLRYLYGSGEFFAFMLVYFPVCVVALLLCDVVVVWLFRRRHRARRLDFEAVYVGAGGVVADVCRRLGADFNTNHNIVGYYGEADGSAEGSSPVHLGSADDLVRLLKRKSLGEASIRIADVFCCTSLDNADITTVLRACDAALVGFHLVPYSYGNVLSSLTMERVDDTVMFTAHLSPLFYQENKLLKRVFDVVVSFAVCVLLLPFLPLFSWLIKRESPGPLFFKQARTGLDGKTFTCYKFRSMHVNDASDSRQATKCDARVFRFGRFMRRTNLDEFPQFFNVLRGDMSIVGPRPHMTRHTEMYSALVDKFMVRHFSKPGITGYAQVYGARGETKEVSEMEERIRKDIYYMEHWSFWLDIKIIFLTIKCIFVPDKNAY